MSNSSWNFNSMVKRSKSSDSCSSNAAASATQADISPAVMAELEQPDDEEANAASNILPPVLNAVEIDRSCLEELLCSPIDLPPSDLYRNVVLPSFSAAVSTVEAMQADSGSQRSANKQILSMVQHLLLRLDINSDGYLTSELFTTIMSNMIEELDGVVEE